MVRCFCPSKVIHQTKYRSKKPDGNNTFATVVWLRSTMDSIRVSEAPDSGSIPDEATDGIDLLCGGSFLYDFYTTFFYFSSLIKLPAKIIILLNKKIPLLYPGVFLATGLLANNLC
jgi:hypothetical protein